MNNWRTRALLGASTAAVLIALAPFSDHRVSEREVFSRIAGAPAAVSQAVLPPAADKVVETLAQDMAALVRRGHDSPSMGGAGAPESGSAAVEPFPLSPQIPSEAASSPAQQQDAASRSAP